MGIIDVRSERASSDPRKGVAVPPEEDEENEIMETNDWVARGPSLRLLCFLHTTLTRWEADYGPSLPKADAASGVTPFVRSYARSFLSGLFASLLVPRSLAGRQARRSLLGRRSASSVLSELQSKSEKTIYLS